MAAYAVPPTAPDTLHIADSELVFPVRRVYCVGRNYRDHVKEMEAKHAALGITGSTAREPPFFFQKSGYGGVTDAATVPTAMFTSQLEFECELVVALTGYGKEVGVEDALGLVGYYGVGVDLTRRDLQNDAKAKRRPWDAAKNFDNAGVCGRLVSAAPPSDARMELKKNGAVMQSTTLDQMIFNVAEAVSHLSNQVALCPGDIIFTGTPMGVGPVAPGDTIECSVTHNAADVVPRCSFTVTDHTKP